MAMDWTEYDEEMKRKIKKARIFVGTIIFLFLLIWYFNFIGKLSDFISDPLIIFLVIIGFLGIADIMEE